MSAQANRIRDAFLQALASEGATVNRMDDLAASESNDAVRNLFLALGRAGREFYLVRGVGFINVHVRSEDRGWWGILKSVKKDLDTVTSTIGLRCYYVLLVGRADHFVADGYIISDLSSSSFLKPPGVDSTKYTINEKQHLNPSKRLLSIQKVAKTLMALHSERLA